MFVLLSENPDFSDKLERFICLSAVMFLFDAEGEAVAPLGNILNKM